MAQTARKLGRLFIAIMALLVGVAMLVLPGPGLLTIAIGLGILGKELRWAWVLRVEARLLAWTADVSERPWRRSLRDLRGR